MNNNDFFFDNWEKNFDKNFKRASKFVIGFWVASALASLAITGVAIWAIIMLVNHFAS